MKDIDVFKYIEYYRKVYNIGDVFSEIVLTRLFDTNKLDKIPNRKLLRFIGSEIPTAGWMDKNTYCCGMGWRDKNAVLDKDTVDPSNFCYIRGKISRQRVIDSGVNIPKDLAVGDTGLLASLFYTPKSVKKKYNIGIVTHYVGHKHSAIYKAKASRVVKSVGYFTMGDETKTCEDFFEFINSCDVVLASSLHAIIFCHSFGVPVLFFSNVDGYKFSDYYSVYDNINYDFTKNSSFDLVLKKCLDTEYVKSVNPKRHEVAMIQRNILNAMPYKEAFTYYASVLLKNINRRNIHNYGICDSCCGCGSCISSCNVGAITVINDNGFLYPKVNTDTCVNCGRCSSACPVINLHEEKPISKHLIGYTKDPSLRYKASSGGVIPQLMDYVISNNGAVFGVAFNEDFSCVQHIMATKDNDVRERIYTSKYVECSSMEHNVYADVKRELNTREMVMFIGTPCQVAGLSTYLGNKPSNLLLVEIVCHGVPSNEDWNTYRKRIEKEHKSKLSSVNFRDKANGWKKFNNRLEFKNGDVVSTPFNENPYMKSFLRNENLRNSCYTCKFRGRVNTNADITIGDLWGIEKLNVKNDDKGHSLINANSVLGRSILDKINDELSLINVSADDYKTMVAHNKVLDKRYTQKNNKQKNEDMKDRLIVTFTSWKKRITNCIDTIHMVMNNTVVPDVIYLNLSSREFPKKELELPKDLVDEAYTNPKLIINWVDGVNTKSMKKIFPILQYCNPNDIVISVDDDIVIEKDFIASRLDDFERNGRCFAITSNCSYTKRELGMMVISAGTLFQAKMLAHHDIFVNDVVLGTNNDDRTCAFLLHLNGYKAKPASKYCVGKSIGENVAMSFVNDNDGLTETKQIAIGKSYDDVVIPYMNDKFGFGIDKESFGKFNRFGDMKELSLPTSSKDKDDKTNSNVVRHTNNTAQKNKRVVRKIQKIIRIPKNVRPLNKIH